VSPLNFIPLAEETGLITKIGSWVLHQACSQLVDWDQKFPQWAFEISINLSVRQFAPTFIAEIDQVLATTDLLSDRIRLEITESVLMDNTQSAEKTLKALKVRNIQLSIDDFGTGYSSLSYLNRFPVGCLKIDQSFVSQVNERSLILEAIVDMAHKLGMCVVAEGIETAQQLAYLRSLGCDFGQGYYFSKPLEPDAIDQLIASSPCW
jgi:EAL domain-containing protein (putative c-di-GMP-specific phosphodiesterase class I)